MKGGNAPSQTAEHYISMENFNIVWHYKDLLLKGLGYTVFVSVAAILIALCVGMLLSVMRMGGDSLPSRILKKIVAVYISLSLIHI